MSDPNELFHKRVLYTLPQMEQVNVQQNIIYYQVNDEILHFDIYSPSTISKESKKPVVILIHGEAPYHNLKDAGQFQSLGQLIAASGMTAVSFDRRTLLNGAKIKDGLNDINNVISYLRQNAINFNIDISKLALWSVSAGVPFGLYSGLLNNGGFFKCQVVYYGFGDFKTLVKMITNDSALEEAEKFLPLKLLSENSTQIPPIFIARAGLDNPILNKSLDNFILKALETNLSIDVFNHPTGHHAFDLFDDNERTKEIINKTLGFLSKYLFN